MKVQCQLKGTFYRQSSTGEGVSSISLAELLREVQAVATQTQRRTPQLLRESFGLDFVPRSALIELLKQFHQVTDETELYQLSGLQFLHPQVSQNLPEPQFYDYLFVSCDDEDGEVRFSLQPDDRQIPVFPCQVSEQEGIYTLILTGDRHPSLSPQLSEKIWKEAIETWDNLEDSAKIDYFLTSISSDEAEVTFSSQLSLTVQFAELPPPLQQAIQFLQKRRSDRADLPGDVANLVEQYRCDRKLKTRHFPDRLEPQSSFSPGKKLIFTRNSRNTIAEIINKAEQFLLVSSYIIEDEDVAELICQKSSQLPQGVWILTDLRDEVIDRIDSQVESRQKLPISYQRSDEKKIRCLRKFLATDPNQLQIRSGKFHLKTCISEQYAYLGSCNLTAGSLDRNLESGIIWRNTPLHSQLIQTFGQFWDNHTQDDIIGSGNVLTLRSIPRPHQPQIVSHPQLLNPRQYYRDLLDELRRFRGNIVIISRSFRPTPELRELLKLSNTRVFIDSQMNCQDADFTIIPKDNCHAKITLIQGKVAYIGGINFNFYRNSFDFHDLMYKTTNKQEISAIVKCFKSRKEEN
ncbi:phospholipase D-like domain-containing protein [Lyngbya sp. CCY1209]|uniref:phospholipase D-like domain-containing protein n=1 Tax=Lyngbya sp. CCY1209 TaxID=2886103 RepID=UPI002D210CC8|nr:phospholipase D-like domain-containing protein [Lyngbya sp. CCY1209]MEB3883244.1 phospholipase D family protein [Lyngbya sp. CCY1209]